MKRSYPAAHDLSKLSDALLVLKIARHSPCQTCETCPGLSPASHVEVVLDDEENDSLLGGLEQYGSDDDDSPIYLELCACGHSAREHGAEQALLGREEFMRKAKVGIRCDELLKVCLL